jgi:hypothetical protein
MQDRILQVTHLGNFQPWLPWHIVDDDHNEGRKTRVLLRLTSPWLPTAWGIDYSISLGRSCRQPPNMGK